jgi:beta-N-acetylhexosaminidase
MSTDISLVRLAHALQLPAIDGAPDRAPAPGVPATGGSAVLLGETRAEYVARRISPEWRARESSAALLDATDHIREHPVARGGPICG